MDYYEPRDNLDEAVEQSAVLSPIQQLYEGAHIFITGGSGFMGKVLLEKILRTCNVARIYILVRDKKGTKSKERLATIFNDKFFEPLKLQKPRELKKVIIVTGDCSLPDLGLSEEHKTMLSQVSIIFHAAATLSMDQHLRIAYVTNVLATKVLLEFAKTLPHLQAFMYVSTAYTHAYRETVEETFYNVVFNEDEIGQLFDQLDNAQIGALTPKLIGRWGNTYALTKACAENLISKYNKALPIGVVRPSVVVSVKSEPLQGWINNLYGAMGVVTGTASGLLRTWCVDPDMVGDMIPVDVAINMTLAATWEVAIKNTDLKIYNLVSSTTNPITWDILRTATMSHGITSRIETNKAIAYHALRLIKNKTFFTLYSIWYHIIPAIFIDLYLQFTGKQPQLTKIYTKIYNVNKSLMPYCAEKHISFTSNNVDRMWEMLDSMDQRLFNFDLAAMSWNLYWLYALRGMRVFVLDDPMETVAEGEKLIWKLWIRMIIIESTIWISLTSLMYLLSKQLFY